LLTTTRTKHNRSKVNVMEQLHLLECNYLVTYHGQTTFSGPYIDELPMQPNKLIMLGSYKHKILMNLALVRTQCILHRLANRLHLICLFHHTVKIYPLEAIKECLLHMVDPKWNINHLQRCVDPADQSR
jgi:hypothetical protein